MQTRELYGEDFFTCFYEQYKGYLYKLAWDHSPAKQDACDLAQTVWEKLLRHESKLRELSHEQRLGYIATTIINTVREDARKRRNDICSLETVQLLTPGGIEYICHRFDRAVSHREFLRLWPLVDASARELLERKYFLEESNEEIAHAMGISPNSVRMYLTRAKRSAASVFNAHREQFY